MLHEGKELRAVPGRPLSVLSMLGAGGQGEVYRVRTEQGEMAVKWYFPHSATAQQREIIERLVEIGLPDDRFLWPKALVLGDRPDDGFGYLMDLRPATYEGLPAIFKRRVKTTPRALVTACIQLVEAYRTLHSSGIAYRDISWGNVFFDPGSGGVLVCDNDNAVFEGDPTGIEGTIVFMAPELVRRDPHARPSTQTDLHALAVLLFMLLMNHHPLEGARELHVHCMDLPAQKKLYGSDPVFIFDPENDSNRPVPGEHDTVIQTWRAAPSALQEMFVDAFTRGLHHPNDRVRESQWREMLSRIRDTIVYCPVCNRQNYHDEPNFEKTGSAGICWACQEPIILPPRITIGGRVIMLNRDAVILEHHLTHSPRHDFEAVVAAVTPHPIKPGLHGLTNRSEDSWLAEWPDGSTKAIDGEQTVPLRDGLHIKIRGMDAEIRGDR